jgi:hypothetical protein
LDIGSKQQSERRLAFEHEQENDRSKIDLALRATDFFGPSGDAPASSAKSAAGLLALAHLDFVDLALALLIDLWSLPSSSGVVSTETAIQVINAALISDMPDAQLLSAQLLLQSAGKLEITTPLHWPSSVDRRWVPGLPFVVRLLITDALVHMALASRLSENAPRELAARLYGAYGGDPEVQWKGFIGTLISAIIPALKKLGYMDFSGSPGHGFLTLQELEEAANHTRPNEDDFINRIVNDRAEKLAEWSRNSTT